MLECGFNPRGMETCRGSIPPPLRLHSCFCGFPWLGHGEFADARHAHAGRAPKCKRKGMERNTGCRQRPYRVECTGSLPNSEVKRRRARLVLGWGTAREDLRVLLAFVRVFHAAWPEAMTQRRQPIPSNHAAQLTQSTKVPHGLLPGMLGRSPLKNCTNDLDDQT